MKPYHVFAVTFYIVSAMLFVSCRMYRAITCIVINTLYYYEPHEIAVYVLSAVFLLAALVFTYLSLAQARRMK